MYHDEPINCRGNHVSDGLQEIQLIRAQHAPRGRMNAQHSPRSSLPVNDHRCAADNIILAQQLYASKPVYNCFIINNSSFIINNSSPVGSAWESMAAPISPPSASRKERSSLVSPRLVLL